MLHKLYQILIEYQMIICNLDIIFLLRYISSIT